VYTFPATVFPLECQNPTIFILGYEAGFSHFLSSNIFPLFRVPFFDLTLLTPDNIRQYPPPMHASQKVLQMSTLSNCIYFTTALRPSAFRLQYQMTEKYVPVLVALLSDEKSLLGCRLTSSHIASPYFTTSGGRQDYGYSVYHCSRY
jgi:hypothetical protein